MTLTKTNRAVNQEDMAVESTRCDVCVVGAGPAGIMLA